MNYEQDHLKLLIGKTLTDIYVGEYHIAFRFTSFIITNDYKYLYGNVSADCCSETFMAEIKGVRNVLGQTILAIEDLDFSNFQIGDLADRQESDSIYGFALRSELGICEIYYVNASNGYYSGWISWQLKETNPIDNVYYIGRIAEDWRLKNEPR